ncbi:unnamed protein product [Brassica napus]|uniref:(rape) hypothetical protein n=1 Tax=Brassica napus TaxID=3708 RepID=A0A816L0J3_BRANA|nr:unnamed protein product [Brassica napus]
MFLKGRMKKKLHPMPATPKHMKTTDACSNTMSWMVQTKKGSVDGLPIQRVVKKEKKINKTMPGKKVKIEKPFSIPQLNDQSISTEDWENHLKWQKSVKCRLTLEALASMLNLSILANSLTKTHNLIQNILPPTPSLHLE